MPAGVAQSRHALLGDGQILVKEAEKALEMPVKHCLWGTGSSDSRFPQFCEGVRFVPFAKPSRTLETFLRWSKAVGCPYCRQSNVNKIIPFLLLEAVGILHTKGTSELMK